jgi:hypothetical protein
MIKDLNVYALIKKMRCLVCNRTKVDVCHVKSRGAGGSNEIHNLMPLCRIHHQEQGQIGILTFISKYDAVESYLTAMGWEITSRGLWNKHE